ncbi:MAG: endonuclease/exonuclease/phosphatase family protein [archaeon]
MKLKIATINIQIGVGVTKGYWEYLTSFWKYLLPHSNKHIKNIIKFIKSEDIDILGLTEVEGISLRSNWKNQYGEISDSSNLSKNKFFQTYKFGKFVNMGNAFLSKYNLTFPKKYSLPGKGEPRYLCETTINFKETNLKVFITHLGLNKMERQKQILKIKEIIKNTPDPKILLGDFNSNSNHINFLDVGLTSVDKHNTYPSWKAKKSLDRIFYSGKIKLIKTYTTSPIKFSDHLPLIAEFEV